MMLPTRYRFTVAALCSVAMLGVSLAQQQDKPQDKAQDKSAATKPPATTSPVTPAPIAGKATLGIAVAEEAIIAPGWRASKLLKTDVYNDANEKIGKIDDFVVAPDGKLSVAVVETGGFLGVKGHRVAIPLQQFSHVGPKTVLPGATKEALKALPEFRYLQ
jgi:sporulation protein YlmC with PRC-barrel domain